MVGKRIPYHAKVCKYCHRKIERMVGGKCHRCYNREYSRTWNRLPEVRKMKRIWIVKTRLEYEKACA